MGGPPWPPLLRESAFSTKGRPRRTAHTGVLLVASKMLVTGNYIASLKCVECGRGHRPGEAEYVCLNCGGNLEVLYDYDRVRAKLSKESLASDRHLTMWRYRPLLPIEESSAVPPLTVGWTPIYDCPKLAERYAIK